MSNSPLSLHPDNPHYFLFRGKPTVLITSGEHYGAVINLDFNYTTYLEELASCGFNMTRTFTGVYVEYPEFARIEGNTQSPRAGRFICPWQRSSQTGAADGGNKFNLDGWDPSYFARLRDFCSQASKRGIVVELSLFCVFYDDKVWALSPMNAKNNINGVGAVERDQVYTLRHSDLVSRQDALVTKIVQELNGFDNLYFEICNEPAFLGVEEGWQRHVQQVIAETEAALPVRHLIGRCMLAGYEALEGPYEGISIYNFHYSNDLVVHTNYHLNKVIGCNETGLRPWDDDFFRREAWLNIVGGGALHNHLDMTFAVGHERGTLQYTATQPAGGSPELRRQLKVLKDFIDGFDFLRMQPANEVVKAIAFAVNDCWWTVLADPGKAYAMYLWIEDLRFLQLQIPKGQYTVEWMNPKSGAVDRKDEVAHAGGVMTLSYHVVKSDVALRILKVG